jgi:hypothetical protein
MVMVYLFPPLIIARTITLRYNNHGSIIVTSIPVLIDGHFRRI